MSSASPSQPSTSRSLSDLQFRPSAPGSPPQGNLAAVLPSDRRGIVEALGTRDEVCAALGNSNSPLSVLLAEPDPVRRFVVLAQISERLSPPGDALDQFGLIQVPEGAPSAALEHLAKVRGDLVATARELIEQHAKGRPDLQVGICGLLAAGIADPEKVALALSRFVRQHIDSAPDSYELVTDAVDRMLRLTGMALHNCRAPVDAQIEGDVSLVVGALRAHCPEVFLTGEQAVVRTRELLHFHDGLFRDVATVLPCVAPPKVLTLHPGLVDRSFSLGEKAQAFIDAAVAAIVRERNVPSETVVEDVMKIVTSPTLELVLGSVEKSWAVTTPTQLIGMLLRRMSGGRGDEGEKLTTAPDGYDLGGWLDRIMTSAGIVPQDSPGGASANMARNLPAGVCMYLPANPPEFVQAFNGHPVDRLYFRDEGGLVSLVQQPLAQATGPKDQAEIARPIEFGLRSAVTFNGTRYVPEKADRVIVLPPAGAPAARVPAKPTILFPESMSLEAQDEALGQIGRTHDILFLNGTHYLKNEADIALMNAQLRQMRKGARARDPDRDRGFIVHAELSKVGPFISEVFDTNRGGAGVDSMGMSDDQLVPLLKILKTAGYDLRIAVPDSSAIANNAWLATQCAFEIARLLSLPRLYVHTGSMIHLDIVVRRDLIGDMSEEARRRLELEQAGVLAAKYLTAVKVLKGVADRKLLCGDKPILFENLRSESFGELGQIAARVAAMVGERDRAGVMNAVLDTGLLDPTIALHDSTGSMVPAVFVPLKLVAPNVEDGHANDPLAITGAGDCTTGNASFYGYFGASSALIVRAHDALRAARS